MGSVGRLEESQICRVLRAALCRSHNIGIGSFPLLPLHRMIFHWRGRLAKGGEAEMKTKRFAFLLPGLVLCGLARDAGATFMDGNKLYRICSGSDGVDLVHCAGYIEGVMDTAEEAGDVAGTSWSAVEGWRWCDPPRIITRQAIDVVVQFLGSNPQVRHFDAALLIAAALQNAWPCPATATAPPRGSRQ
jgi:Rap1a immunity proteins